MSTRTKIPHRINVDEISAYGYTPPSPDVIETMSVKMVYGTNSGLMISRRPKGYHARPHHHVSEQFNYVLEGEIWFFVEDQGFRCVKGDFVRIPPNAVHWNWVRAEGGCVLIQSHTPSLTGDPQMDKGAIPLLWKDEERDKGAPNIWIDYPEAAEIERRAIAADPD